MLTHIGLSKELIITLLMGEIHLLEVVIYLTEVVLNIHG
jgi:hypothetical protein